ncbi:hypothetical protein ACP70R_037070 [Stipagrostis hirtigluma subsp. patula]
MALTYEYDTDVVMADGTVIKTTVTSDGNAVERFLDEVRGDGDQGGLLAGIDTEWRYVHRGRRSGYRTAVLQLCVGHRCLVFHIVHADHVPDALRAFLASPDVRFFGVGVDGDVTRLSEDYGMKVDNAVELTLLAAEVLSRKELVTAGLKTLTHEVMGVCIDKPKSVTMSKWDALPLSWKQVQYACIDAFVSYEIGRLLLSGEGAEDAAIRATISRFVSPFPGAPRMQPGWIPLP